MPLGNGERADRIPVVIGAHLRQSPEPEARGLSSRAASPELIPAPQKRLPDTGEGDYRRAGIHPLAAELDAPALSAEPAVRLKQRDPVPGAPE
jgi:hypothetical protein